MTPQIYLWTESRPFKQPNGLGFSDTILHVSKTEPTTEVLSKHFCILTTLEDTVDDARTLKVPPYATEFIAELIDKVDIKSIAIPANLEIFDGPMVIKSQKYEIGIPDFHGKYRYAIDTERIASLYNDVDALLYKVDIIHTVHDEHETPDDCLKSPEDDAFINTWLKEFYLESYERAGLTNINDTWIGYQGPIIMGTMSDEILEALKSLNNKIN